MPGWMRRPCTGPFRIRSRHLPKTRPSRTISRCWCWKSQAARGRFPIGRAQRAPLPTRPTTEPKFPLYNKRDVRSFFRLSPKEGHPRTLLSLDNISMRYGARILFEDVTATFLPGRRYAITGPNGAGKSTLMKIMEGELEPEKGTVTRPKRMGILRQDQFAFDAFRVIDTVVMGNAPLWAALQAREQ